MHDFKISMTLETPVNQALDLFRHHEKDKYLFDSIRGHLEEITIFPREKEPVFMKFPDKKPIALREFNYTPRLVDNYWPELDQRPAWQYEVHLKFLRIAKIKGLTTLVRVQCLNLFFRFYAFLYIYVRGFFYDVGTESCIYVVEYMELLCRKIEQESEEEYEIPLDDTHLAINFMEKVKKRIELNAREEWARSKGFKTYKEYRLDYMKRLEEHTNEYRNADQTQPL